MKLETIIERAAMSLALAAETKNTELRAEHHHAAIDGLIMALFKLTEVEPGIPRLLKSGEVVGANLPALLPEVPFVVWSNDTRRVICEYQFSESENWTGRMPYRPYFTIELWSGTDALGFARWKTGVMGDVLPEFLRFALNLPEVLYNETEITGEV